MIDAVEWIIFTIFAIGNDNNIMMKKFLLLTVMFVLSCMTMQAQRPDNYPPDNINVTINHTNLPIVWIDVNGAMILRDERITAHMKIIHNGDGQLNYADTVAHPGQHVEYDGYIALRYRGHSSFARRKKPYSFRPLTAPLEEGGEKQKVKLLGMGKDNNWALLAPHSDQTMVRDLLAREMARPWMEFTPQGRYCELYLDGIYYGVYILAEVVSKGKHRLNLDDPGEEGDELTGGYIMEVDRAEGMIFMSTHHPVTSTGVVCTDKHVFFQYVSPDYEDMSQAQINYIKSRVRLMENVFASADYQNPETGYRQYIDVMNFIDYQLAEELGHNVDAYRLSGKFFKRRDSEDPRFKMVLWDMDLAYGIPYYLDGWRYDTWSYQMNDTLDASGDMYLVPFWWYKLNNDPANTAALKARWAEYRRNNITLERIYEVIDSLSGELTLDGAITRNSQARPRWGVYVWPNNYIPQDYNDALSFLKQWLAGRIAWMDEQLDFDPNAPERGDVNGDGAVNISDVTALINYLLTGSAAVPLDAADCDLDGKASIPDVTTLINYLLSGSWSE